MRLIFTCITILFWSTSIHSQRVSEEEVGVEAMFIAANQKKIIGKYDEAVKIYLKLLEKDPINAVVLHDLARVYHKLENLDEAVKAAKKATRYAPDNTWFKLTLAQFKLQNLEFDAAGKSFGEIAAKTGDRDIYRRWAQALIEGQKYQSALEVMDKMDTQFGKEELRSDDKIELYLAMDDEKSAVRELQTWIDENPNEIYHLVKLGKFYTFIDERKKAIRTFEEVLDREPKNGDALIALQNLNSNKGNNSNDKIKSLVYSTSLSTDMKVKALIPVVTNGTKSEVQSILPYTAHLATTYTDHAQSQALHADALYLTDNVVEAKTYYKKTLELEKSNYQVWDQLMSIYDEEGEYSELSKLAELALDYFPNQGGPYYYIGKAAFSTDDLDEAKEMLSEATIIGRGNKMLQSKVAKLNANIIDTQGDTNGAISLLESIDSDDPTIYELIGDLYIKIKEKTKASEAFSMALKKGGDQLRLKQKIESI